MIEARDAKAPRRPGTEDRATEGAGRGASVYVHFPYCLEKCPYCDFVSYKTDRRAIDHRGYADAVLAELDARIVGDGVAEGGWQGRRFGSVFFGGGTPSLWEPAELGRVLEGLRRRLSFAADVEVTVECNPTSLDEGRARGLLAAGVNRLSVGVQSLRDAELRFLGRLHDADGALKALRDAVAAGAPRLSADLIFGLPEQAPEDACEQAGRLAGEGLRHLSCYQLTIEPGTQFGERARVGRLPLADDGRVAEAFLALDEALTGRGFAHYEVSNYAHPGEEARHNLGYWRGEEYLGLGCGAYGFARAAAAGAGAPGAGVRYRNLVAPAAYVARSGDLSAVTASAEALDATTLLRERIMLGLRLEGGFDLDAAAADLGTDPWTSERRRALDALVAKGRVEVQGSRLRVPRRAWLWCDDSAARLF